jgi:tRNA pseudouridine55 synthase
LPVSETAPGGKRAGANGVLLLDKPSGITSSTAVQKVRRLFDRAKAGHTGTLDPLATGLLPICLGEATKFSHPILTSHKSYLATMRLGWRSTTGDAEGTLSEIGDPDFSDDELAVAIREFTGEIEQTPPMYSAVKVDGERLYKLARKGVIAERKPRRVHIHHLEVMGRSGVDLKISVTCSKGTYIRTLAEDIAERLGSGAYLTALRRVAIGSLLSLSEAVGMDELERMPAGDRVALLKPVDLLLTGLPKLTLSEADAKRLCNGLALPDMGGLPVSEIRVYSTEGRFLGLGEVHEDRSLKSKRLLSQAF